MQVSGHPETRLARQAEPPVRGRGQRRCIGILGGSSGLTSDSFSRSDSAAKDVRDNAILSAAMRSGAVASRQKQHPRLQAKAAARRVTGAAVVLLSSRIESDTLNATRPAASLG